MRHAVLTCKNHPDLRWSCKEIAVTDGKYNGSRNIFFKGRITDPPKFHSDMSGVVCDYAPECDCKANDLIIAPEDAQVK